MAREKSLEEGVKTADLSTAQRSGRDDNSVWERYTSFPSYIVISTGAYPDFLPRSTGRDRVGGFH
jgi:hypothetical protein